MTANIVTAHIVKSALAGIDTEAVTSGILPIARGGTGTSTGLSGSGTGNVVLSNAPTLSNVTVSDTLYFGNVAANSSLVFLSANLASSAGVTVAGNVSAASYAGNGYGLSSLNMANMIGTISVVNGGTGTTTSTGSGALVLSNGPTLSNLVVKNSVFIGDTSLYDAGSGVLSLRTNGTTRANIDPTGLNITGNITGDALALSNNGTVILNANVYSSTPSLGIGRAPGTGYQLDLSLDTARKLTSTTWTTGSDERIKEDIELANLELCCDLVDAIPLKRFAWKESYAPFQKDRHQLGWIAQDVEAAGLAKAVVTSKEYGLDDFKSLNPDQLYKIMWGALQHHLRHLRDIETVVDALETA